MSKYLSKNKLYEQDCIKVSHSYLSDPVKMFRTSTVSENGVMVSKGEFVEVHPDKQFEGLKVQDFALSNILALGNLPENTSFLVSESVDVADRL